jgi:hypothetical protein
MPVDGQLVARTVAELRAMPEADALLVRLERVVEATRTVVGAGGWRLRSGVNRRTRLPR